MNYVICLSCGHSYTTNHDMKVLSAIYQDKYYTPTLEATVKDHAFGRFYGEFLDSHGPVAAHRVLLEVGCSMGSVLSLMHGMYPDDQLIGIDPDYSNAQFAAERFNDSGKCRVICGFFPDVLQISCQDLEAEKDIHIYSRHVIEHVVNPIEFARSQINLSSVKTMAIETPCSDFYLDAGSALDPFHVEHPHVFSFRSLMRLLERLAIINLAKVGVNDFGDIMIASEVGTATRLVHCQGILGFDRFIEKSPDVLRSELILANVKRHEAIKEICRLCGSVVFWGAGSKCAELLAFGLKPLAIFDGNKNKESKFLPGFEEPILHASKENLGQFADCHLVISTSFRESVLRSIKEMGLSFLSISSY